MRGAFPDVDVIANTGERGLSGGRNTGTARSTSDVVVFLDDDARADPQWLERLLAPYKDPAVIGTGGNVVPEWPTTRPRWFPPEYDWVVGCSYTGLPRVSSAVRNPIGASMSFRREAFVLVGGFDGDVGRLGTLPLGARRPSSASASGTRRRLPLLCTCPTRSSCTRSHRTGSRCTTSSAVASPKGSRRQS